MLYIIVNSILECLATEICFDLTIVRKAIIIVSRKLFSRGEIMSEKKRLGTAIINLILTLGIPFIVMIAFSFIPIKSIAKWGIIFVAGVGISLSKRALNRLFDAIYCLHQARKKEK